MLSEVALKGLRIIADAKKGVTFGEFAGAMYGHAPGQQCAAGRMLRRFEDKGLIRLTKPFGTWMLTGKGKTALELPAAF